MIITLSTNIISQKCKSSIRCTSTGITTIGDLDIVATCGRFGPLVTTIYCFVHVTNEPNRLVPNYRPLEGVMPACVVRNLAKTCQEDLHIAKGISRVQRFDNQPAVCLRICSLIIASTSILQPSCVAKYNTRYRMRANTD